MKKMRLVWTIAAVILIGSMLPAMAATEIPKSRLSVTANLGTTPQNMIGGLTGFGLLWKVNPTYPATAWLRVDLGCRYSLEQFSCKGSKGNEGIYD